MDSEKLQQSLDKNASLRKKEISNLTLQIQRVDGEIQNTLLRAAIVLLYAHFEGFSKEAIKVFIKFLNSKQLPVNSMKQHLKTLHYTKQIVLIQKAKRKKVFNQLIERVLINDDEVFRVNEEAENIVVTEGNLKFEVLEDLLFLLGLEAEEFYFISDDDRSGIHTKREFIDREVIGLRNSIAHGEPRQVKLEQFEEVKKFVIDFIDSLKEHILMASLEENYMHVESSV
ncbi:MAE_28990/MAE_18760 family HEPN-like nuclease [Exiguobacterium sp. TNDT2]|uniref:MAE_28990/MAE_18760 family HEPN-like nuclease n=1 Tax=Exiguobacterium sp. TNDT2 TaxID=2233531 RepID=UPI000DEF3289|nr:MAE_28990/MAE_18760 family HEPN-like nuclease [Exiguobacterium sp. TNDT2]